MTIATHGHTTVICTRGRKSIVREDLIAQGLWDFHDRLEQLGYDVRVVSAPAMDRHLTVAAPDGSWFKITGYGKDDLTLTRYADHASYESDDVTGAHAGLTERTVLDVLDALDAGTGALDHLLSA